MRSPEVSSPSRRRRATVAAALAAACVAAVPAAHAQDPGVVFEPGSPSYKEYSIPLEEARRDAGGGIPDSIESRAFGIGLSRRGAGRGASRPGAGPRGGSAGEPGAQGSRESKEAGGSGSGGLGERLADAEAAGAPFLWKLAPLLLVLLPGLIVGLLLAARRGGGGGAQPVS